MQVRQRIHDDDGEAPAVPITVRQLEAVVRVSEALARMQLCWSATQYHVQLAMDLFKVSTLNAANAGMADNLVCCLLHLQLWDQFAWSCDICGLRALSGS
jgi:DNA replication licensing factor MCM5